MAKKFNYTRPQSLATRQMARFGTSYIFTRETDGVYDTATSTTPKVLTDFDVNMVWLKFSRAEIDGTLVQTGDARPLVEAKTEPQIDDTFIRNGYKWRVLAVDAIEPAGTVVLYRLQVRRG